MSSTDKNNTVDVQAFIDSQPVATFQWRILFLCFLVTAIDGLDTAAIGFIAPALREHWQIGAADLGPVLGAALVGLMLGAFMAGPLADRFGRKRVLFQIGGKLGALCLGAAMDRFDPHNVLVLALLGGAACLFAIGQCHGDYAMLGLSVAGMGFCISGSQVGANALAAAYYPTASRATGVSWAHGVGRIGSLCGTFGGALLVDAGLSFEVLFGVLMLPAVLAAAAILFKGAQPATALRANTHVTL